MAKRPPNLDISTDANSGRKAAPGAGRKRSQDWASDGDGNPDLIVGLDRMGDRTDPTVIRSVWAYCVRSGPYLDRWWAVSPGKEHIGDPRQAGSE
jgi:hypothetical protein